ncbi:MAG: hypothetical protein ACOY31_07145 [Bacillota bacterium]
MAMEEKDIYNLEEEDLQEEKTEETEVEDAVDQHIMYHSFYGF